MDHRAIDQAELVGRNDCVPARLPGTRTASAPKLLASAAVPAVEPTGGAIAIASLNESKPELLERAIRLAHKRLPQNSLQSYSFAVFCVLIATALRFGVGALVDGPLTPFGTYYPAVLVATLVGGVPSGLLALFLAGAGAWWLFMPVPFGFALADPSEGVSLGIFCLATVLIIAMAEGYRRAYHRLDEAQAGRQLLLRELQHRNRNTSAVVQAVITQSLQGEPEAACKINNRIRALLVADELISHSEWQTLSVAEILQAEMKPYGRERVRLEGGDLRVDGVQAKALALIFHELATNAAKYGALSNPRGVVAISWTFSDGTATIEWKEGDGPKVVEPTKRGFGTSFIERVIKSIGGSLEREFRKEGFRCRLSLPTGATRPSPHNVDLNVQQNVDAPSGV